MANRFYIVNEATWQELRRMKRKLDGINGPGVTNAPDSLSINLPSAVARGLDDRRRPKRGIVAVLCTVDGGSAGSDSTTCDFTYTITTLGGRELATGLTPLRNRISDIAYNTPSADSYGLAFKDSSGDWVLTEVYEEYETVNDC